MTNDDSVKEQHEILDVKFSYSVLTEDQAHELLKAVHETYKSLVEKWCNTKLPDDWGSIEIENTKLTRL